MSKQFRRRRNQQKKPYVMTQVGFFPRVIGHKLKLVMLAKVKIVLLF